MHTTLLSKIDSHAEVRKYLNWHQEQCIPLRLMFESNDGHLPAFVVGFDEAAGTMKVTCTGMLDLQSRSNVPYAVIGSTASGARFLASGYMSANPAERDNFTLSFPTWLDVSQSRDCYRCLAPFGHTLHFSSIDPHLNDIVCKVKNVSLEGLAVEWELDEGAPTLSEGAQTDDAILQSSDNKVHLGKLRVAHITYEGNSCYIGLTFDQSIPKAFGSLVMDAQRTLYLR